MNAKLRTLDLEARLGRYTIRNRAEIGSREHKIERVVIVFVERQNNVRVCNGSRR